MSLDNNDRCHTVADLLWMNYFNEYLYRKELITESDRNHMKLEIEHKYQNVSVHNRKTKFIQ